MVSWAAAALLGAQDSRAELTPAADRAIHKALVALAKGQARNGSFSSTEPVAGTSMVCLAFMASGSTPSRGPYAANIRRGLEYILKCGDRSGFLGNAVSGSTMHAHGFATLFLAEALGMIEDPSLYEKVHEHLRRAVKVLEGTQNRFGGWNTAPDPTQTDDGSGAVAIMQIMALRAARSAGLTVKQNVIDKSRRYILDMTTEDGWYQYNWNSRGAHRSSGLTGPGTYMLGAMDMHQNPKYERGIRNLIATAPFLKGARAAVADSGWSSWYYYTLFYASLAIFQRGGSDWRTWYSAMREDLIRRQSTEGLWEDPYGGLYSAFACLSLELPYRCLPCFQEGGRGREGR